MSHIEASSSLGFISRMFFVSAIIMCPVLMSLGCPLVSLGCSLVPLRSVSDVSCSVQELGTAG